MEIWLGNLLESAGRVWSWKIWIFQHWASEKTARKTIMIIKLSSLMRILNIKFKSSNSSSSNNKSFLCSDDDRRSDRETERCSSGTSSPSQKIQQKIVLNYKKKNLQLPAARRRLCRRLCHRHCGGGYGAFLLLFCMLPSYIVLATKNYIG